MNNDLIIDPRFVKPKNVVGLSDPEEEGSSGSDGGAAGSAGGSSIPKVEVPVVTAPPQAEVFSIVSQQMVLDQFGTYKVEALLEIKNDQPGVNYHVRLTAV